MGGAVHHYMEKDSASFFINTEMLEDNTRRGENPLCGDKTPDVGENVMCSEEARVKTDPNLTPRHTAVWSALSAGSCAGSSRVQLVSPLSCAGGCFLIHIVEPPPPPPKCSALPIGIIDSMVLLSLVLGLFIVKEEAVSRGMVTRLRSWKVQHRGGLGSAFPKESDPWDLIWWGRGERIKSPLLYFLTFF